MQDAVLAIFTTPDGVRFPMMIIVRQWVYLRHHDEQTQAIPIPVDWIFVRDYKEIN